MAGIAFIPILERRCFKTIHTGMYSSCSTFWMKNGYCWKEYMEDSWLMEIYSLQFPGPALTSENLFTHCRPELL